MLHKLHNGSSLRLMSAKELVTIPIWKGNRIMDKEHSDKIGSEIDDIRLLDSGYHIIIIKEKDANGAPISQPYIIDGQHRAHILKNHFANNLCEPDFKVVITEKRVDSETEAINYFTAVNNVKPQKWDVDPAITINNYIVELEKRFNSKTTKLIRQTTRRPYMAIDKLREALGKVPRLSSRPKDIQDFGRRALEKNEALIKNAGMLILANNKNSKYYEEASKIKFMLAVDFGWISEILVLS